MSKTRLISFTVLLLAILGITIGWSTWSQKMYDYNHSEVTKIIERLPFEPKIPSKVPFKGMNVSTTKIDTNQQQMVVTLTNIHKESLDIRVTENPIEYPVDLKSESIQLGQDLQGVFIPNDSGKRILTWQEQNLTYEITFYYKLSPNEVSKKQLIKMAESFK